ncbi:PorV/PorQ family protein [bacterium]|nr:PorV/PorQ family protein [bacterium]
MRKLLLLYSFLLILHGFTGAAGIFDNAGTSAYPFLKLDIGARAASLGGAYSGYANSPEGFATNPGVLGFQDKRSVVTTFTTMYASINSGFLAYYQPLSLWRIGGYVNFMDYGKMTRTDNNGRELGTFGAQDLAFAISLSRAINRNLSWGVTPKLVYSAIDTFNSVGFALDAGGMWEFNRKKTRVGLVIANMGFQKNGYTDSHKDPLPLTAKLGGSSLLPGLPMILCGEVSRGIDEDFKVKIGGEIVQWKPHFLLRIGWQNRAKVEDDNASNEWLNGLNSGFGIYLGKFSLDYGFSGLGTLGNIHRFTLSYTDF